MTVLTFQIPFAMFQGSVHLMDMQQQPETVGGPSQSSGTQRSVATRVKRKFEFNDISSRRSSLSSRIKFMTQNFKCISLVCFVLFDNQAGIS